MRIKDIGLKLAGRFVNLVGDRFFTRKSPDPIQQPYMPIEPDTTTGLNNNAVRFSDLPPQTEHRLNSVIDDLLVQHAFLRHSNGEQRYTEATSCETLRAIGTGEMRLELLEEIHRLLCGDKDPSAAIAVDNGSGRLSHLAVTLSIMGTRVVVKDPDKNATYVHRDLSHIHGNADFITHATSPFEIMQHTPADVVYWTNPAHSMDLEGGRKLETAENSFRPGDTTHIDYLGRDVKPGGFLVIQTDLDIVAGIAYDPSKWIAVHIGRIWNKVIPTNFDGIQWLVIYEKK